MRKARKGIMNQTPGNTKQMRKARKDITNQTPGNTRK